MVKIVLRGLNKPAEERFVCDFCECVFDTDEYDEAPSAGRLSHITLSHKCPFCGRNVYIFRSKIE